MDDALKVLTFVDAGQVKSYNIEINRTNKPTPERMSNTRNNLFDIAINFIRDYHYGTKEEPRHLAITGDITGVFTKSELTALSAVVEMHNEYAGLFHKQKDRQKEQPRISDVPC